MDHLKDISLNDSKRKLETAHAVYAAADAFRVRDVVLVGNPQSGMRELDCNTFGC